MSDTESPPRAAPLASVYFGYFAAVGMFGPFLALYLERHGFAPDRVAFVLALLPFFRIVSNPAWTALADRLRSASAVLRIVAVGSFALFGLFELGLSGAPLVLALLAFTVFRSPVTSLVDVLALHWSARNTRPFGQIRAWGTIGYTVATFGAGVFIRDHGPDVIIHITAVLLALTAIATFTLPAGSPPERTKLLPAFGVLFRRPRFVAFLASAALHQFGLGAYDSLFPAYFSHLADPTVAGFSIAVGTAAEVLFMTLGRGLLVSLGLDRTLALAYAITALRWGLVAFLRAPWALVVIQLLHAFTFGAFYLAGVALVDEESPREVRASAQGIFGATTWGLASSLGLALAGWMQRHGGLPRVFQAASIACVMASVIAWRARTPTPRVAA